MKYRQRKQSQRSMTEIWFLERINKIHSLQSEWTSRKKKKKERTQIGKIINQFQVKFLHKVLNLYRGAFYFVLFCFFFGFLLLIVCVCVCVRACACTCMHARTLLCACFLFICFLVVFFFPIYVPLFWHQ